MSFSKNRAVLWMAAIIFFPTGAESHEFWIAPETYTSTAGNPVSVGLKVGQMMAGADYPYLSDKFEAFTSTTSAGTTALEGVDGDVPALVYDANTDGLNILALETLPLDISFDTFAEFADYLAYEGLQAIADIHRQRGLTDTNITERYIRCAKSLIQVGPPRESHGDRPVGMPFELIAGENPYANDRRSLSLTLLWKGKPVPDRQIAIFRKSGAVTREIVKTDLRGIAVISLEQTGEYLVNAVQMTPVEKEATMWESHWASLTFEVKR